MSHLSILPTAYTRVDLLEASLRDEGFDVVVGGLISRFGQEPLLVDLLARLGMPRPWAGVWEQMGSHHGGGSATHSPSPRTGGKLQRVARRYALRAALDAAEQFMPGTPVMLDPS